MNHEGHKDLKEIFMFFVRFVVNGFVSFVSFVVDRSSVPFVVPAFLVFFVAFVVP